MQTWEYRVIQHEISHRQLDELGRDGWELVAVTDGANGLAAYLKRPILGFKERVTLEQREKYARTRATSLEG